MKLIVIDMQKALMDPALYNLRNLTENVASLIRTARENGIEVIYVQHDAGPGTGFSQGDPAFEIADAVAPEAGEKVFVKTVSSAFSNRDFEAYLKASGDEDIMVVGLQTNYCVDATVKSAFERDYGIVIPVGANSTFDNPYMSGKTTCDYYANEIWPLYAEVVPMDEALNRLKKD